MLNILSFLVGLVALVLAIPAFVPLLGWMNWGVLLIAVLGFGLGALSSRNGGRNFNMIVILVCIDRKSVVEGKSVTVSVDLGASSIIKNKKNTHTHIQTHNQNTIQKT